MDDELDRFKQQIDLREYAASMGYALVAKESSRASSIMKNGDNDKIVIARDALSQDFVYFSVRNWSDNGTIIDFLKNRGERNLGHIRKTLRSWLGDTRPHSPLPVFQALVVSTKDVQQAVWEYEKAEFAASVPYLVGRGLGRELTGSPRFKNTFKVDERKNVLFPHYNRNGLCGFEKKNLNFTGFAGGGVKGLWASICLKSDVVLVIAESAIDALSYQALNPELLRARYLSIGGSMNPDQLELLVLAMGKMKEGKILLGLDNDPDGDKLAEQISDIAPRGARLERPRPKSKDWNQDLKNKLGL